MKNLIKHLLLLSTWLVLSQSALATGDADNGKVLFEKSKCTQCHGTDIFTREDRKVKDIKSLETQVRMCDSQLNVNWFDDEIKDVVAYLDMAFYKFSNQADEDNTGDSIIESN
jgi:mono/diheme cytochrome c family protein